MEKCASQANDSTLLAQVASGDRGALGELFTRHSDRLRRMVLFRLDPRLQGRLDADDILQDAYMAAARRIQHFDPAHGALFVWLRLITLQTLDTIYRSHFGVQMRDVNREIALPCSPQATSLALADGFLGKLTSPSQAALRKELGSQLESALAGMSSVDQDVLAMRHFEDLTNSEIAEILQIEPNTASIRYVRAIERLRKILQQIPGLFDS